jgi:prophage regulatory protein
MHSVPIPLPQNRIIPPSHHATGRGDDALVSSDPAILTINLVVKFAISLTRWTTACHRFAALFPGGLSSIITPKHMEEERMRTTTLPETGFVRLSNIIGDPKANPPIPPIIPVSKSTWWAGVKSGRYPKPVKTLGPRITVWKISDIRALIDEQPVLRGA